MRRMVEPKAVPSIFPDVPPEPTEQSVHGHEPSDTSVAGGHVE